MRSPFQLKESQYTVAGKSVRFTFNFQRLHMVKFLSHIENFQTLPSVNPFGDFTPFERASELAAIRITSLHFPLILMNNYTVKYQHIWRDKPPSSREMSLLFSLFSSCVHSWHAPTPLGWNRPFFGSARYFRCGAFWDTSWRKKNCEHVCHAHSQASWLRPDAQRWGKGKFLQRLCIGESL